MARAQQVATAPSEAPADESVREPRKSCFVVCPIGGSASDTRRRSDQILRHIIEPAARQYDYDVSRSDLIDSSGSITSQIITNIITADVIIADLTDHNPNVFYELAIRHAAAKPFVQMIQEGQTIPFDISNYRTIFVDHTDLDSAAKARDSLNSYFEDFARWQPGQRVDTPVSQAVDFEGLKTSTDPNDQEIATLSREVSRLAGMISQVGAPAVRRTAVGDNEDFKALRDFITYLAREGRLVPSDQDVLITTTTSTSYDRWIGKRLELSGQASQPEEPPF